MTNARSRTGSEADPEREQARGEAPATTDARGAELNAGVRRAMREARSEAVIVLAIDVALFAGLAGVDKLKGWDILDMPWWAWLLLARPRCCSCSCYSPRRARS